LYPSRELNQIYPEYKSPVLLLKSSSLLQYDGKIKLPRTVAGKYDENHKINWGFTAVQKSIAQISDHLGVKRKVRAPRPPIYKKYVSVRH
jgi:hypothetical protein